MSKIGVPPDIVVIMVSGKCVLDKNEATWPQLWCTPSFKTGYERGLISHILSKMLKIIATSLHILDYELLHEVFLCTNVSPGSDNSCHH